MHYWFVLVFTVLFFNSFGQLKMFINEGLCSFSSQIHNQSLLSENSAALTDITKLSAAIHTSLPFLMKELKSVRGVVLIPSRHGNFHFNVNHEHFGALSENNVRLGYAKKLSGQIAASASFGYAVIKAGPYKSVSQLQYGFSFMIVAADIRIGIASFNPVIPKFVSTKSSIHDITIGIDFSTLFYAALNINKSSGHPPEIRSCFSYALSPKIVLSATASTGRDPVWLGVKYGLKKYACAFSFSFHETLGITPSFTLSTKLVEKK